MDCYIFSEPRKKTRDSSSDKKFLGKLKVNYIVLSILGAETKDTANVEAVSKDHPAEDHPAENDEAEDDEDEPSNVEGKKVVSCHDFSRLSVNLFKIILFKILIFLCVLREDCDLAEGVLNINYNQTEHSSSSWCRTSG